MRKHHDNNYNNSISRLTFQEQEKSYLEKVVGEWCNKKWISTTQSTINPLLIERGGLKERGGLI